MSLSINNFLLGFQLPKDDSSTPKRRAFDSEKTIGDSEKTIAIDSKKTIGYPQPDAIRAKLAAVRNKAAASAAQRQLPLEPGPEPEPRQDVKMTTWSERARALPRDLARSALFSVAGKREPRAHLQRARILALNGIVIEMTGMELRQDDLDVWLQVTHLARDSVLGVDLEISGYSLLQHLDWGFGQDRYNQLRECLSRLREAVVWVRNDDAKRGFSGNLLSGLDWREGLANEGRAVWTMRLDPRVLALFGVGAVSLVDWEQRAALAPLARWLHGFFSTHTDPHPMKVETLHGLCGSRNARLSSFRDKLKLALQLLQTTGFLESWSISKADLVTVKRSRQRLGA